MNQFVMFLDESGDHNLVKYDEQYPVFTLIGCIFDSTYYSRKALPLINALKRKHFGQKDIILHSYDIRKAKNEFNILLNQEKRENFITDMNNLMSSLEFTIIASCIRKDRLTQKYHDPADPYVLAFAFIIERYVKFLNGREGSGYFSIESRDPKSNRDILEVYDWYRENGNDYCSKELFLKVIEKNEFVKKSKNINGHQIADLAAYPTSRFCLNRKKENKAFEILIPKFRRGGNTVKGYGYKEFPQ